MRLHKRYLWLIAPSMLVLAMLPSIASSEPQSIEAVNEGGLYGEQHHHWSNAQQTVLAGEKVTFSNLSPQEVPHGVEWRGALKPSCEEGPGKVPVGTTEAASGTKWSGKCTFSQTGTYTFWCTVHHAAMSGTITVKNPGEPIAITAAAKAVGEREATLEGMVNPEGKPTKYLFKWGTTESYGHETSVQTAEGTSSITASAALNQLAPGTIYHFRLVATNENGTAEGADETFMTGAPSGPPTATTGQATGVSETAATLTGTVDPDGEATNYFFKWGTTTGYGQTTGSISAGEDHASHSVSAVLKELAPGTTYHYQLLAENHSSTVPGADHEFTTSSSLSPPSIMPTIPPVAIAPILPQPKPEAPPLLGPPLVGSSLVLTAPRHGSTVHGSIDIGQAGAGGRLEVDLLAKSALLSKQRGLGSKSVRIGRLIRQQIAAGKLSFSVALTAQGKRALAHRHSLPLTVKLTLTPGQGAVVTVTRSVTLRA